MLRMRLAEALAFVLLIGTGATGQAQEKPESLRQVVIHQVKPDMVAEFEDLLKNEQNYFLKLSGRSWRQLWRTEVFGDVFRYMTILPLKHIARFDGPTPRESPPGIRLLSKIRKCVSGTDRFVVLYRHDLSIEPQIAPTMALVVSVGVLPGKNEAFESFIQSELLPAMKKAGVTGCTVTQTVLGGDTNEWTILSFVNSFAELDAGNPLVQVPGKTEATELYGKLNGIASYTRVYVARCMPELSYGLDAP